MWVPKTHLTRSCNHAVFVDEGAQDVGSLEVRAVGLTGRSRSGVGVGRCALAEGPVRTVRVVAFDVFAEHGFEVMSSEDEHSVEALSPGGALVGIMRRLRHLMGCVRRPTRERVTEGARPRRAEFVVIELGRSGVGALKRHGDADGGVAEVAYEGANRVE